MTRLIKAIRSFFSLFTTEFTTDGKEVAAETSIKRRRKRLIFFSIAIVLILATTAQLIFYGPRGQIPIMNNLLVLSLLNLNILLLLVMVILVGRNLVKLYMERTGQAGGGRFRTKLVLSFAAFTLIPSALLFFVASGLLTKSIDNWVSAPVEQSLKDSLELADTLFKNSHRESSKESERLARLIGANDLMSEKNKTDLNGLLLQKLYEYDVDSVVVFDKEMDVLDRAGKGRVKITFSGRIGDSYLNQLLNGKVVTESLNTENSSIVVSIAPVFNSIKEFQGAVMLARPIDRSLVEKIASITKTFDEYKQLKLQKTPIKAIYEVTLLLVTLVILFAAIWYGFHLARDITVPIYKLGEATEKVKAGDLSVRVEEKSNDEIGILIRSFNSMTGELELSHKKLESSHNELVGINLELDRRRKYIETILSNIAAGVISIDNRGRITTCNPAAISTLKIKIAEPVGKYYEEIFEPDHLDHIRKMLREMGKNEKDSIEKEVQLNIEGASHTNLVNITNLRDTRGRFMGIVVVFEDITAVIKAQKTSAWRDVAQNIAHEIKNPLTPIRLNAERMLRKYSQDPDSFGEIFESSTRVIIHEVEALKRLVDEFSRFAQLPEANLVMTPLHGVLSDVIRLYKDLKSEITIKTSFDPSIGNIRLDKEQMRSAFRNLIENAVDAVGSEGIIEIRTSRDEDGKKIHIDIIDNGPGIKAKFHDKVFLPYFSTKKKGVGLGLAIVNRIVADHEGRISVKDNQPHGTVMAIELPAA